MQNVSLDKFPLHQEMIGQALQEDAFSNPIRTHNEAINVSTDFDVREHILVGNIKTQQTKSIKKSILQQIYTITTTMIVQKELFNLQQLDTKRTKLSYVNVHIIK